MYFTNILTISFVITYSANGLIHKVSLKNVTSDKVTLSSFGFLNGGVFSFQVYQLTPSKEYILSLQMTKTGADFSTSFSSKSSACDPVTKEMDSTTYLILKPEQTSKRYQLKVECPRRLSDLRLTSDIQGTAGDLSTNEIPCNRTYSQFGDMHGNFNFSAVVTNETVAGRYLVSFYQCHNPRYTLKGEIIEKNVNSYLSAGAMAEPTMCVAFSLAFLALGFLWLYVLKSSDEVFKMHYLMLAVVWIKSLSLLLHAVNLHYVSSMGHHERAWAILYYVAYLIKATLLFITIILIGTGWVFIKHVLTKLEKKLFIFIIPLQILENIAYIIIEESVDFQSHIRWKVVFTVVDIICCLVILVFIYWSIKHLQLAASRPDKLEMVLKKLKLFRHFYIIVVAYIYSTRIIVILFLISLPFYLTWVGELFKEFAILTFFILTGYKFRPSSNNPYLAVPTDDDDKDVSEVVVGKLGMTETVFKVSTHEVNKEGQTLNISYDDD